jgi:uncharacterized protein
LHLDSTSRALSLVTAAFLCLPFFGGCTANTREAPVGASLSRPEVLIELPGGQKAAFSVEIADTPKARETGLMFRKELADNAGMLFIFEDEAVQAFWMKNTYLPLDMIFVSADTKIVGVVHDAVPESLATLSVGRASIYVLEINGGLAKKKGIVEGQRVQFRGFNPQAKRR